VGTNARLVGKWGSAPGCSPRTPRGSASRTPEAEATAVSSPSAGGPGLPYEEGYRAAALKALWEVTGGGGMEPNRGLTDKALTMGVAGVILVVVGLGLFFSGATAGMRSPWEGGDPGSAFVTSALGIVCIGLGSLLIRGALAVGAVGQAAPLARWLGEVVGEVKRGADAGAPAAVKVRCPGCGALNAEAARFCSECGKRLLPDEPGAA
jgi:hypothetical protein